MPNPYQAYDAYGLRHLPAHLIDSQQWDLLAEVLTDLRFIEAKCAAGMAYDLIADYAAALDALPEAQEDNRITREREARMQKYIQDLIAYAKGDIQTLEIIPSVEPWSEERIKADIERIKTNPTRLDRVRAFAQFVNAESHNFLKFGTQPGFCLQQAYNSARSGPISSAAESLIKCEAVGMLLRLPSARPEYNPYPALLKTIKDKFNSGWLAPDGKRAVTWRSGSSSDSTLQVWDLELGICRHILEGHTDSIEDVSITPDGKRAVSGGKDKTLCIWDPDAGSCLYRLEGHIDTINSLSITPNGKCAVSGSMDKTLRVWDLEYGRCLKTLEVPTYTISSVIITPNGKRAVLSSAENTLQVWDLEYGRCMKTLEIPPCPISSIMITQDGKQIISESHETTPLNLDEQVREFLLDKGLVTDEKESQTLRLWDLESGICLRTLEIGLNLLSPSSLDYQIMPLGYSYASSEEEWLACFPECRKPRRHWSAPNITSDGMRVVSIQNEPNSTMSTVEVWDLQGGIILKSYKGCSQSDKYDCYPRWTIRYVMGK